MIQRRLFLQTALAAAVSPVIRTADAAVVPERFAAQLTAALAEALKDAKLAERLAPVLLDVGFTWSAPAQPAESFQTILAYAFGNRPALAGAKLAQPGPTNEALAKVVEEAQRRSKARVVYAQWEIARFLRSQEGVYKVVPIEPVISSSGAVVYLSTDGVAQAVVADAGGAAKLGRVCVIGHHDHAKRCVQTSRARGMDAWAMEGLVLPVAYDPQSDQAWTRDRETYLIHDMAAQMMALRAERVAAVTKVN